MARFRPCLNHGTVVAYLALFVALGGGAFAASALIGSDGRISGCVGKKGALRVVKAGGKCKKGEKALKWNQTGGRGLQGLPGTQGLKGDKGNACLSSDPSCKGPQGDACLSSNPSCKGPPGDTGPAAASMIMGNTTLTAVAAGNAKEIDPSGPGTEAGAGDLSRMLTPNATVIVRDLSVRLVTAPGGSATRHFELHENNGASTGVGCDIGGAATTCDSGVTTASVPPGTPLTLSMQSGGTGTAAGTIAQWGFRATTP